MLMVCALDLNAGDLTPLCHCPYDMILSLKVYSDSLCFSRSEPGPLEPES